MSDRSEKSPVGAARAGLSLLELAVLAGFALLCFFVFGEAMWHLFAGWAMFIGRTLSRMRIRWEVIWSVAAYTLALTVGAHFFLRWLYREIRGSGNNPSLPGVWRWRWTLSGLALFVLMFAAGTAAVALVHQTTWLIRSPHRMYTAERSNRVACASHLKIIGIAIELYVKEHTGKYPDDLAALVMHSDLPPGMLVCPSSLHLPAPGQSPKEQAANLAKPGHCSYVYLGKGLAGTLDPMRAIVVEHTENHEGAGMNVLFADGHVEWFHGDEATKLLTNPEALCGPSDANANAP